MGWFDQISHVELSELEETLITVTMKHSQFALDTSETCIAIQRDERNLLIKIFITIARRTHPKCLFLPKSDNNGIVC